MLKDYILLSLLLIITTSQCPATFFTTNMTTDIVSFADNQTGYIYTFKYLFSSPPSVALAINDLSIQDTNAGYFVLYTSGITSSSLVLNSMVKSSLWKIAKVSIWISSNSELLLGITAFDSSKLITSTNSQKIFKINSSRVYPVTSNIIARSFIIGLNYTQLAFNFSISSTNYSNGQITLFFTSDGLDSISQILVSYVVFPLNNQQFTAYGGYVPIDFSLTSNYVDLVNSFSDTQNMFYGFNSIGTRANAFLNQPKIFQAKALIGSNFILTYLRPILHTYVISYIFLGYPATYVCNNCGSGQNIYYNNQCYSVCPLNTVIINLANGGKFCRTCIGNNKIASNGVCVCQNGYQMINNTCLAIGNSKMNAISSSPDVITSNGQNGVSNPNVVNGISTQNPASSNTQSVISSNPNVVTSNGQNGVSYGISTQNPASSNSQNGGLSGIDGTINTNSNGVISQNLGFSAIPINSPTSISQSQLFPSINYNCPLPNSFWNGNVCSCIVSYVLTDGQCKPVQIPTLNNLIALGSLQISFINQQNSTSNCQINSYYNGSQCICNTGFYLISQVCTTCQANSQFNGASCQCNPGYVLSSGNCILTTCPSNSINNGLGVCICNSNMSMVNGVCTQTINCKANSIAVNGVCICQNNTQMINGICAQCPANAYWSFQSQQCVYFCGLNSAYNTSLSSCQCLPGFGIGASGSCEVCQINYYIRNQYCVTCPVNSNYNSKTNSCTCSIGYAINLNGICAQICSANQVYNSQTGKCSCLSGLYLNGSTCQMCPTAVINNQCLVCQPNSRYSNGSCICSQGFVMNGGTCQICSSLPNAYLVNNFCIKCPNQQIYNSASGVCQCPQGKVSNGNACVSICLNDQIMDSNGNCFTCGINQVLSSGICVCVNGYVPDKCGGCSLNCNSNQFAFMGQCSFCPLNMVYYQLIQGCICPQGYYLDAISNICSKSTFLPVVQCASSQFFNNVTSQCTNCSTYCTNCSSQSLCTVCITGYSLSNGYCSQFCGDGLIKGSQTCDTGNSINQGCFNCQIVNGYTCNSQPSICYPTQNTSTVSSSLSLHRNISMNVNNIFIVLNTNKTFTFANPSEMQGFMRATFINTITPAVYCSQEASPNLNLFDCLLIYPSGIPNNVFKVTFSYNYQGSISNLTLTINPLQSLSRTSRIQ